MRRATASISASCVLAAFSAVAYGQAGVEYGHPTYPNTPVTAPQHHASTAQEGYLRGLSNVIDSMGAYQLSHSQARMLMEVARSLHLDNEVKRVEAFYERQYALQHARDQRRAAAEAKREAGRLRLAFRKRGLLSDTYALRPDEFNASSGAVQWPDVLDHPSYADHRAAIEAGVAGLAVADQDDAKAQLQDLERACDRFKDQVREDYRRSAVFHTPEGVQQHVEVQKFLTGVRYAGVQLTVERRLARTARTEAALAASGR